MLYDISGRARDISNDGTIGADKSIEESRFPCIRRADKSDDGMVASWWVGHLVGK